jgi:hypothetical protein
MSEENPYRSPPKLEPGTSYGQYVAAPTGDGTGGIIPYKNPPALIGYYLGIGALVPVFGFLISIPAIVLGIMGLRKRMREPHVKGSVHAWIAIVLGTIGLIGNGLCGLGIVISLIAGRA